MTRLLLTFSNTSLFRMRDILILVITEEPIKIYVVESTMSEMKIIIEQSTYLLTDGDTEYIFSDDKKIYLTELDKDQAKPYFIEMLSNGFSWTTPNAV